MLNWNRHIVGFEDIWLLLIGCVFAFSLLTASTARRWRAARAFRLTGHQVGGTYMLPLVLTIPFYLLLITLIIECTLLLAQKTGSMAAAYAAARAAAVWLPYETAIPESAPDYTPLEQRLGMVRLAAARSMFPFASGSKYHASDEPLSQFVLESASQQIAAYRTYAGGERFDTEYLNRKFAYAFRASTIEIVYADPQTGEITDKPQFNSQLYLTLHYEAPIHTPMIGRLFGKKSRLGNFAVRPITSTMLIESEGVKPSKTVENKTESATVGCSLGITYYDRAAAVDEKKPNALGLAR